MIVEKIAKSLGMSYTDISKIIKTAPHRYKVYNIPKKNPNKYRTIAQPAREVKLLQNWIIENVLCNYSIHEAASAYITGKGIKDNAMRHVKNNYMLKLDFKEFFPSIIPRDFIAYTKRYFHEVYDDKDIEDMCRILFWFNKAERKLQLSIGAPSSPTVSNILMFDFDNIINNFCINNNINYTRYADDLIFSTMEKNLLKDVELLVRDVCSHLPYPSLKINEDKTLHISKKNKRIVTGLVISNDNKVSLGRERKRQLRAKIHHYSLGQLDMKEVASLKGYLSFALDVEPKFIERMKKKYSNSVIDSIFAENGKTIKPKHCS